MGGTGAYCVKAGKFKHPGFAAGFGHFLQQIKAFENIKLYCTIYLFCQ